MAVRQPRYGELKNAHYQQVWAIWRTRHDEPPLCEPVGMCSDYVVEDNDDIELGRKMMELIATHGTPRMVNIVHMRYVLGMGLSEIAEHWGVSRTRAAQIHNTTLHKLRNIESVGKLYKLYIGGVR